MTGFRSTVTFEGESLTAIDVSWMSIRCFVRSALAFAKLEIAEGIVLSERARMLGAISTAMLLQDRAHARGES